MKCSFRDKRCNEAWVDMNAVVLQDPIPILHYVKANHLQSQQEFQNLVNYCAGEAPSELSRAFKAQTKPGSPKFKFGVQVPMGLKQAAKLDKENGNTLWQDAINIELKLLADYKTFRELDPGEVLGSDYKRIPYHIVFDVKFDLRRKARLVAGGNWTDPGREDIYSGVVSIDAVRTGFMLGELNGLTCCATDVGNAFLYGKTKEKVYIVAGPEFGPELEGKTLVVYKSLYSLQTSTARFHETLGDSLRSLGFKPLRYDPDLWYRDRGDHYEYLASYVDDILI